MTNPLGRRPRRAMDRNTDRARQVPAVLPEGRGGMSESKVHIYPVGLLRDLRELRLDARLIVRRAGDRHYRRQRMDSIRYRLHRIVRDLPRDSYWNGYLAEPTDEAVYWNRCGHGWTKRRAEASLLRHIGEVQRDGYLRYLPERV